MPSAYICQSGETLDSIARAIWGDERLFERLTDANPQYRGTAIFEGGERLTVPDLPAVATTVKAPWEE